MGFRLNRTYRLVFEGALEGLEVSIRSTSVGTTRQLRDATPDLLAEMLADHVIDWNYEDEDGKPLPIAPASFLALEEPVLAAIIREWYRAAAGITAPLEQPSTSGASFPEVDIPMVPPS